MKTIMYLKTDKPKDLMSHYNPHYAEIKPLASSSEEFLFEIKSDVYDTDTINQKFGSYGIFVEDDEAFALGKTLQPDYFDEELQQTISFELPNDSEDLRKIIKIKQIEMDRAAEDFYDILINKGILIDSDIPSGLLDKINKRKSLRSNL